jgi:hypothetical protein
MTVRRYAAINIASVSLAAHPVHYICDTTAELPTSGLKLGDTALTVDTNTQYKAASATTWTVAGGGGGGGSGVPATTVTSGVAYGQSPVVGVDTDYAREDHNHGSVVHDSHVALTGVTADQHHADVHDASKHSGSAATLESKTAVFFDATAVVPATLAVWRAPFACTVIAIKGYRVGGSGATVQAYRGTTATPLRSAALSVSSTSTWMDGGAVQNTVFAAGDGLLIAVVSATGSPTQVCCQVDFTRP